jgi:hypothetical protein
MISRRILNLGLALFLSSSILSPLNSWADGPPAPHLKPSLKEFGDKLVKGSQISQLYKESLKDESTLTTKKVSELEKLNRDLMRDFRNLVRDNASFARAEIEDEAVLSSLINLLQLSLLRIRNWSQAPVNPKPNLSRIKDEASIWFQFAADLPYNEASLMGLKVTGLVRSLLIDELERTEKKHGAAMAEDELWLTWMLGLRTPWPVDRMILTEGRRMLGLTPNLVEKVALKIQKDPYLSVEKALAQIPGDKTGEKTNSLDLFKNLWREQDMDGMKTEINRLQVLRLRLACRLYEHRKGAWPATVSQLVEAKMLAAAPVDYLTGRLMALPQKADLTALPQADKSPTPAKNP